MHREQRVDKQTDSLLTDAMRRGGGGGGVEGRFINLLFTDYILSGTRNGNVMMMLLTSIGDHENV